jgi:hypothetical protein
MHQPEPGRTRTDFDRFCVDGSQLCHRSPNISDPASDFRYSDRW